MTSPPDKSSGPRPTAQPKRFGSPPPNGNLIEVLVRQPGKLLSQRYLLTEVWGAAYVNQPSNLRLYMTQLRRKLETDPTRPRHLLTEPGMGYRFQPGP